jgi:2-dehydro-3-deoxy-D-arabinonate dehydratase
VHLFSDLLHSEHPASEIAELLSEELPAHSVRDVVMLAPIDLQEVWGAGVTYERSQVARREESQGGGSFYDKVYQADRPELFLKATPARVVGHGQRVRLRRDTQWCVPEPELALMVSPHMKVVGFTLGPVVTLAESMPPIGSIQIRMSIARGGHVLYSGFTSLAKMARRLDELVAWLGREQSFPHGVILLTGTGIVPPDEFSLQAGDQISISIDGIGTLVTGVEHGPH